MRLKDKVAIVTGAASGLGLAIADLFVEAGAKVVYSNISEASDRIKLVPGQSVYKKCDVSSRQEVDDLINFTKEEFGRLDIMVNNAGIGSSGGALDLSDEEWDKVLQVNLNGVFYGTQLAARLMKEMSIKGSIINISSILGTVGMPGALAYCSAKGGVTQLTRAASLDLAPHNIRVNAISPGFIVTKMTEEILEDDGFGTMVKNNTPLGRAGEPLDIAQAALYLASDEAKYVTGNILHVDGGWTAR